jgi:hypothetical protein
MSYTPLATEAGSTVTVVTKYVNQVRKVMYVIPLQSITVPAGDLDGDGNQIIRIKPSVPTANGVQCTIWVHNSKHFNNDDYLVNDGNIITQTGGSAAGTVSFDQR